MTPQVDRIWKYELEIIDRQTVMMPMGARVLSVGNQNNKLVLWAMCQEDKTMAPRHFTIIGTGNPVILGRGRYVGTAIFPDFVWHVFED